MGWLKWLWTIRTGQTFFDVWSLAHFSFWVFLGSTFAAMKWSLSRSMWTMSALAFGWEIFEHFASRHWPNVWVRGPESWWNSWLSDPLMGVLGVLVGFWIYRNQ